MRSLARSALPHLPERTNREKRQPSFIIHILIIDCHLGRANESDNQETYKTQGKEWNNLATTLWLMDPSGRISKRKERGGRDATRACSFTVNILSVVIKSQQLWELIYHGCGLLTEAVIRVIITPCWLQPSHQDRPTLYLLATQLSVSLTLILWPCLSEATDYLGSTLWKHS